MKYKWDIYMIKDNTKTLIKNGFNSWEDAVDYSLYLFENDEFFDYKIFIEYVEK